MSKPQIPTNWHPLTYAVDEHNKVVWKQGSYAVSMGLAGKQDTLIPGYKVYLCTSEELRAVRHEIAVEQAKRDEEPFTPEEEEELGRMFADGWMRRKPAEEIDPQAMTVGDAIRQQIRLEVAKRGGEPPTSEEEDLLVKALLDKRNRESQTKRVKELFRQHFRDERAKRGEDPLTPEEEEEKLGQMFVRAPIRRGTPVKEEPKENFFAKMWKDSLESPYIFFITWAPQVLVGGALVWAIGSTVHKEMTRPPMAPYTNFSRCVDTIGSYDACLDLQWEGALGDR